VAAEQVPALTVCDQWDQGTATVTVRGELDAATADAFGQRLAEVAAAPGGW
jgi:anti-anti-sigma regulatory factor